MEKKKLKKIFRKIHLYLGFTTGLVVFILGITGCGWVFHDEFKNLFDDYSTVQVENCSFITPLQAKEKALTVYPDHHIHGIAYNQPNEALEVIFYEASPEFYRSVYLNPYNGTVLHQEDNLSGFFAFMLKGHMRLWLPKDIGQPITSYSTLLFLLIIISGIILWWPSSKKQQKQRLTFDWNDKTKWKRKNYDLHSIIGFYSSFFVFLIAFTGVGIGLGWLAFITYKVIGGEKSLYFLQPNNQTEIALPLDDPNNAIHNVYDITKNQFPDYKTIEVHLPESDSLSILVEVLYGEGQFHDVDYLFFDQKTSELLPTESIYGSYADADFSDLVLRMNYDIHVGSIFGLPGKILAFLISLIITTFPVTGCVLWYGKNYGKKKKQLVIN
ncbi:PepSY-associated TM helix domain-containing protein [Flammeovirga pacifica]|uniref:Sulfite reductase n=1 Tax=Flammeovirga pacifica TaxID=915059 RepID=A0A1S1Z3I2_FLAPC|nr:PepSY-associated TM helix domain-containing protein [Flammeovirga pacifica]OHX67844.1 sulfite reductase [Flammeovirga pacifica]